MLSKFPSEYLEMIGSISIGFIYLERTLQSIVSQVTEIESQLINRLIATDSFEVLLTKFKKSVIYMLDIKGVESNEYFDKLNKLCKELHDANEKRNKLLHSFWYIDKDGNIKRHKFKKRISKHPSIDEEESVSLQSLNDFFDELEKLINELFRFKRKITTLWIYKTR